METALEGEPERQASPLTETLTVAAAKILRELQAGPATERSTAIDLLAADALITYALEAEAEQRGNFTTQCDAVLARIVAVASAGDT